MKLKRFLECVCSALCLLIFYPASSKTAPPVSLSAKGFIENKGQFIQTDQTHLIRYKAEFPGMDVYLTNRGLTYVFKFYDRQTDESGARDPLKQSFPSPAEIKPVRVQTLRVDMDIAGGNTHAEIITSDVCEQYYNYYLPHCSDGITYVHAYKKITYKQVYPGIDWVVYLDKTGAGIKHEFVVQPGADMKQIALNVTGARDVRHLADGTISIRSAMGVISEQQPYAYYQQADGTHIDVKSAFIKTSASTIGYEVETQHAYAQYPLVIDPFLTWSTYLGGNGVDQSYNAIGQGFDKANNYWMCSFTPSTDMPVTAGVIQAALSGNSDCYITKFSQDGALKLMTYYGGTQVDVAYTLGIDTNSYVFIAGTTSSSNFPVSAGAYQTTFAGGQDGFILKMDTNGTRNFCTFYGGSGVDYFVGLTVTPNNSVWMVGASSSTNFPVTAGAFQTTGGSAGDGIIVRFNTSGARVYSTYYGGAAADEIWGIDATSTSDVWMAGFTKQNVGLNTAGAFQASPAGGVYDALAIRFSDANTRVYATYYGGTGDDRFHTCMVDQFDNVWYGTATTSLNFPVMAGAYQTTYGGGTYDAAIVKFNNANTRVLATYYGGTGEEGFSDETEDASGNIWFTGNTEAGFPVTANAIQPAYGGGTYDGLLVQFSNAGTRLYASYHGGNDYDIGARLKADQHSDIYIAGVTKSVCTFPLFNPGNNAYYQKIKGFDYDNFISKFSSNQVRQYRDTITASKTTICSSGDSAVLIAATGGSSYTWTPAAGLNVTTGSSVVAKPVATTTYTATYTNANGCVVKDSITITVSSYNVSAGSDKSICMGDSVQLNVTATSAVSYSWSPATGLSSTVIANPYAKPTTTTDYIVTVNNGTCAAKDTVRVSVASCGCNMCAPSMALNNGLLACYPFNANTSDMSGNANNGTPSALTYGNDRFNRASKAGVFNGTNSSVQISAASLQLNTYTYATWVKVAALPPAGNISAILDIGTGTADQFLLVSNTSGLLGLGYGSYCGNPVPDRYFTGSNPVLGTWYHIALSRTTTTLKFYVNGVLLDTRSTSNANADYGPPNVVGTIGSRISPTFQNFNGLIDDVRIYNRALTDAEVLSLFNIPEDTISVNAGTDKSICTGDSVQLAVTATGATSYKWSPTGGLSDSTIVNPYARPTVTTDYVITVSNGTCQSRDTVRVNVGGALTVNAGTDKNICTGDSVQLAVTATGATSYKWSPTAGLSDSTIGNPYAKPAITTDYIITVSNGSCTKKDTVRVNVNPFQPNAGSDQAICSGDSIRLNATPAGATSYTWSPATGLSSTSIANPYAKPAATTDYIVTVTNGGCTGKDTVKIIVNNCTGVCASCKTPIPLNSGLVACYPFNGNTSDESGNGNNGTAGSGAALSANRNAKPNSAYTFDGTNTAYVDVPASPSLNTNTMSAVTISGWFKAQTPPTSIPRRIFNIQDGTARNYEVSYDFTTNKLVYINFNGSASAVQFNSKQTLALGSWYHMTVRISGSNLTELFLNGTLDTSSSSTIVKPVNPRLSIGRHLVNGWNFPGLIDDMRIYNRALSDAEINQLYNLADTISVNAGADQSACKGVPLTLNAFTPGTFTYRWRPKAGLSDSTIYNPVATPDSTMDYIVRISNGVCMAEDTVRINITNLKANAGPDVSICKKDAIVLNGSGNGTYSWSPIYAIKNNLTATPTVNPHADTSYVITVTNGTCTDRDTVKVSVTPIDAEIYNKDTTLCLGDSVQLLTNISGLYTWSPITGLNDPTIQSPYARPTTDVMYTLTVSKGTCIRKDSVTIHVLNNIPVNAGSDQSICKDDSAQLSATSSVPGVTFTWSPATGLNDPNIATPKASPAVSSQYIVTVQSGSCVGYDTMQLTVNPPPQVNAGTDQTICDTSKVLLNASTTLADSFVWSPTAGLSDPFILQPQASPTANTTYVLKGINKATGCFAYDTVNITVGKPHASFTADPLTGPLPLEVNFTNTSSSLADHFTWNFGDTNLISTLRDPSHTFMKEGKYRVVLTAYNNSGCFDTTGVTIIVTGELLIFIPNVFTPNSDMTNDVFEISYTKGALKQMKGTIWNRWGAQIYAFEMPGGQWWDGKTDNTYASDGTYYYIIEATDLANKVYKFRGTVTLIR